MANRYFCNDLKNSVMCFRDQKLKYMWHTTKHSYEKFIQNGQWVYQKGMVPPGSGFSHRSYYLPVRASLVRETSAI